MIEKLTSYTTCHNYPTFHILFALFILSSTPFSNCEIKITTIVDDSRPMIFFERFGFTSDGHVSVGVSHVSWNSKHNINMAQLNPASMGFYLVKDSSFPIILNESDYNPRYCVLSSRYIKLVFSFDMIAPASTYNNSIIIDEADEYNLIFGNCQPEFQVSMQVRTEMYNVDYGGRKNFLPAGQTPLPKLYLVFFITYSLFFAVWVFVCFKQRLTTVHKIHVIMCALLFFKTMKMMCASEDKMYIRNTGTPHGWDVAFYFFGFFKGVTLFTVIILIGTGWSFLKPYLQDREKNVLVFVIPLQVLENMVAVVIGESSPATRDWFTWNEMLLIIDVVCCCTVFFPIIWSIRTLKEASKTDGKAARNVEKLTLFKQFYIVTITYLYFTRVVVSVIGVNVNYKYEWVTIAAAEGASLVFYFFIFYNFQPLERNPYLVIDDEEEANAAQMLEEDDTFEI